jgi:hypothetical protein
MIAAMLATFLSLGFATAYAADKTPTKAASKPTPGDATKADAKRSKSGAGGDNGLIRVATCADGKAYFAPTNEHRGACSGHGGVVEWADGSPVRAKGGKSERYR